jgi:hypothetical protein
MHAIVRQQQRLNTVPEQRMQHKSAVRALLLLGSWAHIKPFSVQEPSTCSRPAAIQLNGTAVAVTSVQTGLQQQQGVNGAR